MKLVTPSINITYCGTTRVTAGQRVVMPDYAATELQTRLPSKLRVSGATLYTRPYRGQHLAGKRLLAWRGGGLGDLLWAAGVLRILKLRYPSATLELAMHPSAMPWFFAAAPDAPYKQWFTIVPEVIPFETWRACDYHLVCEDLVESDREPDQPDCWTAFLQFAGLDPASVPVDLKRPIPICTAACRDAATAWLQQHAGGGVRPPPAPPGEAHSAITGGVAAAARSAGGNATENVPVAPCEGVQGKPQDAVALASHPLILWQLGASTPIRSLRPDVAYECLAALAAACPDALIVAFGAPSQASEYELPAAANIRLLAGKTDFCTVIGLLEHAALLICPDSGPGHIAACYPDLPVLSYWAAFPPALRVGTYPNHYPLVLGGPCAPCFTHDVDPDTAGGCPKGGGYCKCLASLAPADLVARALSLLSVPSVPSLPLFPLSSAPSPATRKAV